MPFKTAIMQLADVGEVPYHLVRDILLKVEDPKKLVRTNPLCNVV